MTIDTLAYAQTLEAHATAMRDHMLPQLTTKTDLLKLRHSLTLRLIAVVAAGNGALLALLRLQL